MKINKIAGICKRAGMIRLYDEHTGDMARMLLYTRCTLCRCLTATMSAR